MADIQEMERQYRRVKKISTPKRNNDIRYPKIKSISRVSKKAPRPSRLKNIGTRFFAALTGTTLFHDPSVLARNIGGVGSFSTVNGIKKTQTKTTMDSLSELYSKATDFNEFKKAMTASFATLTKIMRFESKKPKISSNNRQKTPRQETLQQSVGKKNQKNIPVREVPYKVSKPSPYNTLTSEEIELRKSVRKSWRTSLSFISEAFKERKPIVESWDDLGDYFQGMNCQGEDEGSDLKRNNGFTIRDDKVLIGKKYFKAEHDTVNKNYKALWTKVTNDPNMKKWREKVERIEGKPFARISEKKQGEIMRAKFAIPQPFKLGGDVLDKEAHFFTANEITSNFSVKNIEASIVRAQRERVGELKHKLTLSKYEGKEDVIKKELEKAQNIIRNPSYKKWMEENSRRDTIMENENALTEENLEERQKDFMERLNDVKFNSSDFTVFQKQDGTYSFKVMVPKELNGGTSPYGQMEIELDRYKHISDLPDGSYEVEKEVGGLDSIDIKNGRMVDENAPMVEEPEAKDVALNKDMDVNGPENDNASRPPEGKSALPSLGM